MHMVSGQDLNAAELETDGHHGKRDVETNEDATVYVNDLDLFVTVRPLEDTQPVLYRLENFVKITDVPMS